MVSAIPKRQATDISAVRLAPVPQFDISGLAVTPSDIYELQRIPPHIRFLSINDIWHHEPVSQLLVDEACAYIRESTPAIIGASERIAADDEIWERIRATGCRIIHANVWIALRYALSVLCRHDEENGTDVAVATWMKMLAGWDSSSMAEHAFAWVDVLHDAFTAVATSPQRDLYVADLFALFTKLAAVYDPRDFFQSSHNVGQASGVERLTALAIPQAATTAAAREHIATCFAALVDTLLTAPSQRPAATRHFWNAELIARAAPALAGCSDPRAIALCAKAPAATALFAVTPTDVTELSRVPERLVTVHFPESFATAAAMTDEEVGALATFVRDTRGDVGATWSRLSFLAYASLSQGELAARLGVELQAQHANPVGARADLGTNLRDAVATLQCYDDAHHTTHAALAVLPLLRATQIGADDTWQHAIVVQALRALHHADVPVADRIALFTALPRLVTSTDLSLSLAGREWWALHAIVDELATLAEKGELDAAVIVAGLRAIVCAPRAERDDTVVLGHCAMAARKVCERLGRGDDASAFADTAERFLGARWRANAA